MAPTTTPDRGHYRDTNVAIGEIIGIRPVRKMKRQPQETWYTWTATTHILVSTSTGALSVRGHYTETATTGISTPVRVRMAYLVKMAAALVILDLP